MFTLHQTIRLESYFNRKVLPFTNPTMLWTLVVFLAALQGSRSLLRTNTRIVRLSSPASTLLIRREASTTSTSSPPTSSSSPFSSDCGCDQFADSFVAQKNFLLLEKFERPENGNLTDAAMQYVNFCDESFDVFLNDKIALLPTEPEKQKYDQYTTTLLRYAVQTLIHTSPPTYSTLTHPFTLYLSFHPFIINLRNGRFGMS